MKIFKKIVLETCKFIPKPLDNSSSLSMSYSQVGFALLTICSIKIRASYLIVKFIEKQKTNCRITFLLWKYLIYQ